MIVGCPIHTTGPTDAMAIADAGKRNSVANAQRP
jgi:hypothetical protein